MSTQYADMHRMLKGCYVLNASTHRKQASILVCREYEMYTDILKVYCVQNVFSYVLVSPEQP